MLNVQEKDPYLWLENVDDEKALEWVESMNEKSLNVLTSHEKYDTICEKCLEIYNSDERNAYPTVYGDFIYNFWQGADHACGIWRRSSKDGGLLVGVAFTQRPDLYEAVVCLVPLLDMQRYNKLLAGAS